MATIENLIEIEDPQEGDITRIIHHRFQVGKKYTNAGACLIAINNYEIFEKEQKQENPFESSIESFASNILSNIVHGNSASETISFGGESGSGKTYNAMKALKFLASQPKSRISLQHIEAIETVLKSFGSAKTLKNEDSSRYGCCFELLYQKSRLSGLNIKYTIPLEVSRVSSQKNGEKNFNVFYEIYHGLNESAKNRFGIRDMQKFFYLNQINNAHKMAEEEKFEKLDRALECLGFSDDHRMNIYRILATILHIGNVYFKSKRHENDCEMVEVGNPTETKWIAHLLEVDYENVLTALLNIDSSSMDLNESSSISIDNALDNRDSMAMMIYDELFKWILTRIGTLFKCPQPTAKIAIIDHYGFERYNNNGLEEFLINCTNERIENIFVKHTFHDRLVEYLKDGITINYKVPASIENGKVVELIFNKPYGLLPLLRDECKFPKGTNETYLEHCNLNHLDNPSYGKARSKERLEFAVRHCIGTTWYSVNDFFRKGRRRVSWKFLKALRESDNEVVSMLYKSIEFKEKSDYFVSQAQLLMAGAQFIVDSIENSNANFVRCIRSNNEKLAMKFDIPMVNRQVKSLLLCELIRFRNQGYPVKIDKKIFAQTYRCLLPKDISNCQDEKQLIEDILRGQGVKYENDFKIGTDHIFLREKLADRYKSQLFNMSENAAVLVQKVVRGYLARIKYEKKKKSIVKLQAGLRGWKARRDYEVLKEEMFKELGRTTKRNKRLAAYHQALDGNRSGAQKLENSTTLVGCIDINENAKKLLNQHSQANPSPNSFEIITKYLSTPINNFLPNMKSMSLEEYAKEMFKGHLLEVRREPIMTPFLHKETEIDYRLSIEIFKLVLKYMNDRKLSSFQRDNLGRYILQQGIDNPCQRDEIIVQLINQIHKNKDKVAVELGWKLVHMAISVFPPTENLIPMLIGVFKELKNPLKDQLFNTLQRRLRIYDSEIARELPTSNLELHTTPAAPNTVIEVNCYDGQSYDVQSNPWMTTNEVAERILKQRGVGLPLGWTVEIETPSRVYAPTGTHFIHDVFAEIDGADNSDEKMVHFFSFPPEKLERKKKSEEIEKRKEEEVKETPNHVEEERIIEEDIEMPQTREYPTPEEWIRARSRVTSPDESLQRELVDGNDYAYTLPTKLAIKRNQRNRSQDASFESEPRRDDEWEKEDDYEKIRSPVISRKTPSRNECEEYKPMNFAPPPTFNYPPQMLQYVPVMMPQTMISGQMILPQPMIMQPQFGYPAQYQSVHQYPTLQRTKSPLRRVDDDDGDGYGQRANKGYQERMLRKGDVPSQYSTIRNMPVPQNGENVEQFLDAVFDQVLSKDEHHHAELDAHKLASSIKGGRGEDVMDEYHQAYKRNNPPNYATFSPRSRAKSLPRYSTRYEDYYDNRPQSPDYSSDQSVSSDEPNERYARARHRSFPRADQPRVVMMPVQMNANGEMIILSPNPASEYRPSSRNEGARSRRQQSGVERYMMKRSPSVDGHLSKPPMIRRTPEGIERVQVRGLYSPINSSKQEDPRILPRRDTLSREGMDAPIMTRQIPPRIDINLNNQHRRNNSAYFRSPSPVSSEVKHGLPRLPKEKYMEPIVKSSPNNAEYLNPNRFNVNEERAIAKSEKEKSKEALYKLNQQFKRLPPPVDNVRLIRPSANKVKSPQNSPQVSQPPAPAPAPVKQSAPSQFSPQPIAKSPPVQPTSPNPSNGWIIKDSVDKYEHNQNDSAENNNNNNILNNNSTPILNKHANKTEKPAVKYTRAPWKLTIRKEMFYPGEVVNDIQVIDQIFAQIIEDCRKSYPYRVRLQDRKSVEDILRQHQIPPSDLNEQSRIHPDIKMKVIDCARKWPIYFCQIYEVIELRQDESIGCLFAIAEDGIRLLLHAPHDIENPLKIQEFFPFDTIVDVSLEATDILAVHTKTMDEQNAKFYVIRIKTKQASQIKSSLEKFMSGGFAQKKQLAKAIQDYVTNESKHLSFSKGDVIEILPVPDNEIPPSGEWIYGRIGNRFGFLLSQYVEFCGDEPMDILNFNGNARNNGNFIFDDEVPFSSDKYTMLDFATKYFRKNNDMRRNDDRWTWGDVAQSVKYTDRPINHSLLKDLAHDDDKNAVELFNCIMRFMGDEQLKRNESITDVVFKILLICHKHPILVDEVYCQLIKQTTSNTSYNQESCGRGWRLLSMISSYFPSSLTLKPYLLQYLAENAEDTQRQHYGVARICQRNLLQTYKYNGRKVLMNALEVQNTMDGHVVRKQFIQLTKADGIVINLRPITVAEEVIQELCNQLNVLSLPEQQEFSLCYTVGKDKRMNYCKNDDYLLDVITEVESKRLPINFHFKRTVWVHPIRFDNHKYIDLMFDQIIDDYLSGSMVSTNNKGQLTAITTEEIIRLAAYLFKLQPDQSRGVAIKHLHNIIPKGVIDTKHRKQEEFVGRISRELRLLEPHMPKSNAKAYFLELLSTWPLFVVLHYRIKAILENGNPLPEVTLAIGKNCVRLLQPKSQEVYKQYDYEQIQTVESVRRSNIKFVRIIISNDYDLEFKTDDADEIAHIIGQYIYVINDKSERSSTEL